MTDDKTIIQHYWDRNECALNETEEKYGCFCRMIAENILNNKEDSKECVNDTYLKTWNSIPPERPRVFSAFIGRITRNLAINIYHQKRTAKRGGGNIDLILDELEECIPDRSDDFRFTESVLSDAVNSFIGSLSSRNRKIFMLRYWCGQPVGDIAKCMKMSENSISAVLSRMRKKMQKHLNERGVKI